MSVIHKAQKNKDASVSLRERGSAKLVVDKLTDETAVTVETLALKLESSGTPANNIGERIGFYVGNDATTQEVEEVARIEVVATDVTDGSEDVAFKFYTKNAGTLANRLTVDTAGSLSGVGDLTFAAAQSVSIIDNNAASWDIKEGSTSYLKFDTTDSSEAVVLGKNLEVTNGVDIIPLTAGGCDLGSTTLEWGDIFVADSKSVKFGADQDVALTHDGTSGLNVTLTDNVASALDVKEGSNSLIKYVSTDASELLTIGTVQDLVVNSGQTATDTVKLQAYDVGATAYEALVTCAAHATTPTLTLAATGGITISNAVSVANTMDIVAATSGGSDLGSTAGEWGDIYLGDSKSVQFGAGQDVTITHDGTTGLDVAVADNDAGALTFKDASANSFLVLDSTTGALQLEVGQKIELADTMDIIPGAAGGCDLGSTSAEWGDIFISDNKNIKFGLGQDFSITHDNSTGCQFKVADNDADAYEISDASANIYYTADTTTGTLRNTFSQPVKMANTMDILAATAGGSDLGSSTAPWGDVYCLDAKGLKLGTSQDATLAWDGTDLDLTAAADDSVFKIGNGTNSYDTWTYGETASDYILWDASANTLSLEGGAHFVNKVTAKTTSYNVAATDFGKVLSTTGAAGAVTFTLPAASGNSGAEVTFFNAVDQNMVVDGTDEEILTLNDATADSVAAQTASEKIGAVIKAVCDGTIWCVYGASVGHTFTVASA